MPIPQSLETSPFPEPTGKPERRVRRRAALGKAGWFGSGILVALLALLIYRSFFSGPPPLTAQQVNDTVAHAMASATPPPPYAAEVYQVILPSLVLIQTRSVGTEAQPQGSLGSGVVIDDAGDILTSLHVVEDAESIQLTFYDGAQSSARVTLKQPENDIAVLQADQPPAQLFPAVLGNPNAMQVGDEAYVVGNPVGLYGSMTAGVISGFNRYFIMPNTHQQLKGLIQIDAAVNPGNSGGPVLNRAGQVIGIVEGIVNPSGQDAFSGIGFAVPINTATSGLGSPPD